ncbi:pyridoxal-dependent decarboxylase [Microcoleus sp. ARI1-B5]|uniref:pyridoxal-dependent decarboxylase n=1 Tax=unclassified Microcoleus TaxID=2642155 RepID=UPI002FD25949
MSATNENQDRDSEKIAPLDSENNIGEQSLTAASDRANGELRVSPPVQDPCQRYDRDAKVPGITCHNFKLSRYGLTPEQRQIALDQLYEYESRQQKYFLGYQTNQKLDFAEDLKQYLNFHLNNVGDPFTSGNLTLNTKFMERAVLDYYASLWNARWPHDSKDPESYWGYVLTMGSTEGNLYGMWNGRDYLAGKFLLDDSDAEAEAKKASEDGRPRSVPRRLIYQQARATQENPNAYTPVAFFSEDTHYSLTKATRTLEIKTFYELGTELYPKDCPIPQPDGKWLKEVPSLNGNEGPGSIDIEALAVLVEFFASKGYPILVCFNYGTTFKGAYDDVEEAGKALMPIFEKYGLCQRKVYYDLPAHPDKYDIRDGFWFHVDGALGAAYMPFIEMAYNNKLIDRRGPNFDFRLPFVNSISMSGHKWIGAPWPCGIYITKTKFQLRPPDDPEYLGSPDTTFAGSRNGFSAMIFWDYLAKHSYEAQIEKALYTEELARYAVDRLLQLQEQLQQDLWIGYTPLSLTIRFKQPNDEIVFKYSLSCEELYVKGEKRKYCHIYMMAHVTPELIDKLIADLDRPGAFPKQNFGIPKPQAQLFLTENAMKKLIHVPHNGRGFK